MSTEPFCRHSAHDNLYFEWNNEEEKKKIILASLVDNVNSNNLNTFYPKEDSLFKKRIDKLNFKFYLETEKHLANKTDVNKCQDQLFIILFKQISLYIEEIERLNYLLREKRWDEKSTKERINELNQRQREFTTTQYLLNTLKNRNVYLEKKMSEQAQFQEKIKQENNSLKRQNKFYKEKLQYDLIYHKLQVDGWLSNNVCKATERSGEVNSNAGTGQNELVASIRSASIDTLSKKISISSNSPNVNTNEKQQKKGNEILISDNLPMQNIPNRNDNQKLSKIMNKKRNYSDNNPNQIKKIHLEINPNINNMVGNTRYIVGSSLENGKLSKVAVNSPTNSRGKLAINRLKKPYDVPKDLKIIKTVKQQLAAKNLTEEKVDNTASYSNLPSSKHSTDNECYLSAFNTLTSEINELTELERLLKNMKSQFSGESFINSLEKTSDKFEKGSQIKEFILTDTDDFDGYKSSTSYFSEKQESNIGSNGDKKNPIMFPMLTSITIDLIGKTTSSTDTEKDNEEKKGGKMNGKQLNNTGRMKKNEK